MLARWVWRAAFGVALLGVSSCAELAPVTEGECGNRVVEPGEDCDQPAEVTENGTCGQKDEPGACRYTCVVDRDCPRDTDGDDVDDVDWRCGLDGICRRVPDERTWSDWLPVAASYARDLLVADLDGDGVDDIVSVAPPTIDVIYADASRAVTPGDTLFAQGLHPALGQLTWSDDYGPSIVVEVSRGLGVFTGEYDRTLSATPYASLSVGNAGLTIAPYLAFKKDQPGVPLSATGFFAFNKLGMIVLDADATAPTTKSFPPGIDPRGKGVVRHFDTARPCEQIALGFRDNTKPSDSVKVWAPCDLSGATEVEPIAAVTFAAAGARLCDDCQPLHSLDLNGDERPDLLLVSDALGLFVAYAAAGPGGGFSSSPSGSPADGVAQPYPFPIDPETTKAKPPYRFAPLAIADVNGDCALDFVDASGIYVSYGLGKATCVSVATPKGYHVTVGDGPKDAFTEAAIADVNGDGNLDVIAASSRATGVSVFLGTGTELWNPWSLVTAAPTKGLAVGDFDGDLLSDIMYAELGAPGEDSVALDPLYVSFGATSGGPTMPALIGEIAGVREMMPTYEQAISADLINDVFVSAEQMDPVTTKLGTSIFLFPGSSRRQIDAPYFLLERDTSTQGVDIPIRSVIGRFSGRVGDVPLGDIAVFAKPRFGCAICDARLWLVPTTEHAGITAVDPLALAPSPDEPKATALPPELAAASDVLLGNLGPRANGNPDELVVVAATSGGTYLATATAVDLAFASNGDPSSLPNFDLSDGVSVVARLVSADTNGDGLLDLVLASPTSGLAVISRDPGAPHGLAVSSARGLEYASFKACAGESKERPSIGVAALRPDLQGHQALVVVLPQGAYLVRDDGKELTAVCLKGIAGGGAVAVGDFDGDGIEDIAISEPAGLTIYYGKSVAPGGDVIAEEGAQ